jgi:hypothetical protein
MAWALVFGLVVGCERDGAPSSSPPVADVEAPTAEGRPVAEPEPIAAAPEPPAEPTEPSAEPSEPATTTPTGDAAQAERVLEEYHRIERFLAPRAEGAELSEADGKRLRDYLGEEAFTWYEAGGSHETVRQAWLERMSAQARNEPPSTIRMPLYPNVGWGCEVPSTWVATGNFDPDVTFILPVGDTEVVDRCDACFNLEAEEARHRCIGQRCELQVQGHFTGVVTKPTEHCTGVAHEFHIERATANGPSPTPFFLALPGGSAPPDGPPITEGPRWGVLFANASRHERNARERADALRTRLVDKGHEHTEVLDSRRISTLWCCSFAVLVERFADEKAAKALAKLLERERFTGAVVRQLY